jgi:tetratricopeptide (TPR) repeat protein
MNFNVLLISAMIMMGSILLAQPKNSIFEQGLLLEKQFKTEEALDKYEEVLYDTPDHTAALTHASRMLSNIGGRLPQNQRDDKFSYFNKARKYAVQAITLDPEYIDARLAHIVALGLLSEISRNPREKVLDAKLIHTEAKAILAIDPTYPEAYFVLGKWQLELSRLNWLELLACKVLFGGLPEEISKQAALDYFNKAIAYNPTSILFLFGQASVYYDLGEMNRATSSLKKALSLPLAEPDDAQRKERCRDLLAKIK